jgi:hypothetical protein
MCIDAVDTVFTGLALVFHYQNIQPVRANKLQNVRVPGGQGYFVDPNTGALTFTTAHGSGTPIGALTNVESFLNGAFLLVGTDGWLACPDTPTSWTLFAQLTNLSFDSVCVPISLITQQWGTPGGNWQFGAWQYD